MLQWREEFETGHSLIDSQHRMLISHINRLGGLAQAAKAVKDERESLSRFVDFMETYILTHFSEEEECMFRHKCPVHQENIRAHREFVDWFRKFKSRLNTEGYRPEALKELHESCKAWIQQHILRIDVQLKPCLGQAGAHELQNSAGDLRQN